MFDHFYLSIYGILHKCTDYCTCEYVTQAYCRFANAPVNVTKTNKPWKSPTGATCA